jgi:cell division protein FtsZ
MRAAEAGILELRKHVDTLIVIPNQNLFRIANEKTTFAEAFVLADQVLYSGIACIVDLIVKEGLINLDFADVRTVMSGMGSAMMGTGEATGERRAIRAAEEAIANPLLDEVSLKGAKGLLLSIIGGQDMTLYEVDEAASRVRQEVDPEANIIVGASFDDSMGDRIRVAIVASGMQQAGAAMSSGEAGTSRVFAQLQQSVRPLGTAPGGHGSAGEPGLQHRSPAQSSSPRPHTTGLGGSPAQTVAPHAPGHATPPPIPQSRELWRAPGGIIIEEAPPAHMAHPGRAAPPRADAPLTSEPFTPAAPEDIHRNGRRMPDVGDFPMVGQREYMAKSAQYDAGQQPPPRGYNDHSQEPAEERSGLFQRLIGGGANRGSGHQPQQTRNSNATRESRPSSGDRHIPFFFSRNKG